MSSRNDPIWLQYEIVKDLFPELVRPHTLRIGHIKAFLGQGKRSVSVIYNPNLSIHDIPYRVKADKATRRLHYYDLVKFLSPTTVDALNWIKHLDPIIITNVAIWIELHGVELFTILLDHGLFNDTETLMDRGSALSSYVKRFTNDPDNLKQPLAEINVLTGFLNSDIVPTDWVEKMEELAHGGEPHGVDQDRWLEVFSDSLNEVSAGYGPIQPKFMTLYDYIDSGKWITGGSSSIGEVHWEYDDKQGGFKARKNMVLLLYTTDELYSMVMNWDGVTVSKAFIKAEIAKRRLAVASNFEAYITDSYLMYLYGHNWKNWKYITLDETPREAQLRTAEVSKLLGKNCFALPFDYDSFDHQATTAELIVIVEKLIDSVQVPLEYRDTWAQIKRLILSGYSRGVMKIYTPKGEIAETKVTGGLPSGVRLTSLIGNVWNATVTNIVVGLATHFTGLQPGAVGVRGDDTYVVSNSPAYLGLVRRLYQAVNARGKDTKFGISMGICEFLRNEISVDGQRGWSNRSIVSVTQRKPWSSAPWGVDQNVTVTRLAIDTLSRRVKKDVNFLHRANKSKWSRFYRQSSNWLHTPRRLGGLGIYEDNGWRPSGRLPTTIADRVRYRNIIPTCPVWAEMSGEQQLDFSHLEMSRRLTTDDIPKASIMRKDEFVDAVRKTRVTWRRELPIKTARVFCLCPSPTEPAAWPPVFRVPREVVVTGSGREVSFEEALSTASNVARAKRVTVRSLLEPLYPATWAEILSWERKGWHRTDAINMVLGKTPTELVFPLAPQDAVFVQGTVRSVASAWTGRTHIARMLYAYTRGAVASLTDQGIMTISAY